MPNGEYFEAFPPKQRFGPSILQIRGCFLKANAFYSGFDIVFRILPSICFTWQYWNYRPAMNMCSTETKHTEWSARVLLNFMKHFSWMIILVSRPWNSVKWQGSAFPGASKSLGQITVILSGTKENKLIPSTWETRERPHSFIQGCMCQIQTEGIRKTVLRDCSLSCRMSPLIAQISFMPQ